MSKVDIKTLSCLNAFNTELNVWINAAVIKKIIRFSAFSRFYDNWRKRSLQFHRIWPCGVNKHHVSGFSLLAICIENEMEPLKEACYAPLVPCANKPGKNASKPAG